MSEKEGDSCLLPSIPVVCSSPLSFSPVTFVLQERGMGDRGQQREIREGQERVRVGRDRGDEREGWAREDRRERDGRERNGRDGTAERDERKSYGVERTAEIGRRERKPLAGGGHCCSLSPRSPFRWHPRRQAATEALLTIRIFPSLSLSLNDRRGEQAWPEIGRAHV